MVETATTSTTSSCLEAPRTLSVSIWVGRALLRQEGLDAEQIELPSEEQLNEAFQAAAH